MPNLVCECGFNVDDGLEWAIIMFVEHRKNCKVWQHRWNKILGE